jgi:DNA-binding CsgD family transcriptional regulator
MLDVGQGRLEAASARLAIARPLIGRAVEGQLIGPLAEAAAELALWQARPLEARTEIAAACERLPAEPGYISRLGPLLALGVRAEADVAEIARARRDEHGLSASRVVARGHLETMQRLRDTAVARLPNFVSQADAWLAACQAEATRLEQRSDPVAWDRCADAFGTIPMAYPRAYARWRQAGAMLAVSRSRTSAARPLREAHAIAVELGARPLLEEIDALALRAGMDLKAGASAKRTESAAGAAGDSLGLTRREREILTLIASGRTNRQISEELFITEGTAGTHVSNILGKLGVRARTEAAAVAYKMGLVE